jgi:predicted phosphodiesterase
VLADVTNHPVDQWVCLGDVVQGGPQPVEVVDRLQELGCPVIIGNADDEVLTRQSKGEPVSEQLRMLSEWTAERLGPRGLDFLRTFVPTHEIDLGEAGALLCFHGTPRSFDEVLLPETPPNGIRDGLGGNAASVMCGGHTHLQWTTTIDDGRRFFNPGSVGLAYNRHMPRERFFFPAIAEFAVLTVVAADVRLEFCQVPFDVDELDRALRSSAHPFAEQTAARYRPHAG